MNPIMITMGAISLALSIPAIWLGRSRQQKPLVINGILALVLGLILIAAGLG